MVAITLHTRDTRGFTAYRNDHCNEDSVVTLTSEDELLDIDLTPQVARALATQILAIVEDIEARPKSALPPDQRSRASGVEA